MCLYENIIQIYQILFRYIFILSYFFILSLLSLYLHFLKWIVLLLDCGIEVF